MVIYNFTNERLVEIDQDVYEALESIAENRNINLSKLINIQLRGYVGAFKRGRILDINDNMPYGKYEGILLGEIIQVDPRYIAYLVANSSSFRISDKAHMLLQEYS